MSESGRQLGIGDITDDVTPSEGVDDQVRAEQDYTKFLADLSVSKRNVHIYERQIGTLDAERKRLLEETIRQRVILDLLRPAYAALQSSKINVESNVNQSTLSMIVGGALISVAGVFGDNTVKWASLPAGVIALLFGAWLGLRANRVGWPPEALQLLSLKDYAVPAPSQSTPQDPRSTTAADQPPPPSPE